MNKETPFSPAAPNRNPIDANKGQETIEDQFAERRLDFGSRITTLSFKGGVGEIASTLLGHIDPTEGLDIDTFAGLVYPERDRADAINNLHANLHQIGKRLSRVGLRVGSVKTEEKRGKRRYYLEEIPNGESVPPSTQPQDETKMHPGEEVDLTSDQNDTLSGASDSATPSNRVISDSSRTDSKSDHDTEEKHRHRWRIEEANGPISQGRCGCGAMKNFKNWLSEGDFITNTEHRIGA